MNTYTVKQSGGSTDSVVAGSVHYGADWVKFYKESIGSRELTPIYAVQAGAVVSVHQEDAGVSTQRDSVQAEVPVLMCRSELTGISLPKYTAPADGTAIIKNIVVTNTGNGQKHNEQAWVKVTLGGVELLPSIPVYANSVVTFDLEQVMMPGEVLAADVAYSSKDTLTPPTVILHASGTETKRVDVADTPPLVTTSVSTGSPLVTGWGLSVSPGIKFELDHEPPIGTVLRLIGSIREPSLTGPTILTRLDNGEWAMADSEYRFKWHDNRGDDVSGFIKDASVVQAAKFDS